MSAGLLHADSARNRLTGIGLVSLREALDLSSPIGRAMFALVGVLAEVERAWIVERTHAGLRRARAQGKRLGRPPTMTDMPRLRRLLASGMSRRAAARRLRVSEGTVRLALKRCDTLSYKSELPKA